MTQFCCYRVWDGSHEKHRRMVLILTVIDLFLISFIITYVGISLYHLATMDPPPHGGNPINTHINHGNQHSEGDESHHHPPQQSNSEENITGFGNETDCAIGDGGNDVNCQMSKADNQSSRIFPSTPYFQVVGSRIAKSIQLIVYTCQLFMTVFLVRALLRTDTQLMRTWLIVTEIISTIVLFVFILYLFGDFNLETVISTSVYLVYQFIMIRTMARFIRRTEIELTQFGSIVEF